MVAELDPFEEDFTLDQCREKISKVVEEKYTPKSNCEISFNKNLMDGISSDVAFY